MTPELDVRTPHPHLQLSIVDAALHVIRKILERVIFNFGRCLAWQQ
jgi:hypothetical protein